MANLQNNPTKEKKSTENIVVLPRRQCEDKAKTKRRRNAFFSLYQLSAQQLQNRKNNYFPRLTRYTCLIICSCRSPSSSRFKRFSAVNLSIGKFICTFAF